MIKLTDSQQVVLGLKATDKKGNPTTIAPGSVQWFSDNPDLFSVSDSYTDKAGVIHNQDGTALLKAVGPLGSGTVSCKATVGGETVSGKSDVEIDSGAAVQLEIDAGTPDEQ